MSFHVGRAARRGKREIPLAPASGAVCRQEGRAKAKLCRCGCGRPVPDIASGTVAEHGCFEPFPSGGFGNRAFRRRHVFGSAAGAANSGRARAKGGWKPCTFPDDGRGIVGLQDMMRPISWVGAPTSFWVLPDRTAWPRVGGNWQFEVFARRRKRWMRCGAAAVKNRVERLATLPCDPLGRESKGSCAAT